jgi:putative transposase
MIREYQLNAKDIRHQTMQALLKHIPLSVNGYRCTTEMVLDVVLKASADRSSVEAACADLEQVADSNTIRDYLNEAFRIRDLLQQEAQMNAVLAESIPASMKRAGLEVAIDFHDEPFYGKRPELRAVACRGQAKQGTSHFIRLATAYVIWRDVRLTLTVRYVLPGQAKLDILQGLLDDLQQLGLTFKVLYLDKAFASTEIIRYLARRGQPTLIACSIRGKQGGTRALCQGRKSYRTDYTFSDGTGAELALVASLVPDKTGRRRRKWLAFIVIHLDWSPHKIYRRYRRRFGIECSYRSLRRARASTTSRNPALRFFLVALGLALVNTWIWLRWEFARVKGPGPRRINPHGLRFHRFTRLLVRSIEAIYGVVMTIPTHFSPQSVIY